MIGWLVKRLARSLLVVLVVVTLVFLLARLSGDPAALYVPLLAPDFMREQFRAAHGLDRPLAVQLADFYRGVLRGDLGESIWQKRPALDVVAERLPATLALAVTATALSSIIGIGLGAFLALRPMGWLDKLLSIVSLAGIALPQFWMALVLILLFAVRLGWLPTSGVGDWKYAVMPVIALFWGPMGQLAQVARATLLSEMAQSYTTTARAKGAGEARIVFRHALKNAVPPVLNIIGKNFIGMANGAVVVETVFGWPGIGKLTVEAIGKRDFPVLQACVLVVAVLVVVVNLVLDIGCAWADPKIMR